MYWYEWAQHDLPSFFSPARAKDNADFLRQALTPRFIERRSRAHPLHKLWDTTGPDSFLQLNSLAEDLRLLVGKRGVQSVIEDFRAMSMEQSARHTIRTAALFERACSRALICFLDARNDTTPDYVVDVGGLKVPVEAKMVVTSTTDDAFQRSSQIAIDRIQAALSGRPQSYTVVVVVRDATEDIDTQALAAKIGGLPISAGSFSSSLPGCKIWAQVQSALPGITEHRSIQIYAPVHDKDHLRLKGPAKKASKQLRSAPGTGQAGILALGLAPQHEPEKVFAILNNEMNAGGYRGIAASLLIKSGTHIGHPRCTVVDLLEVRGNPQIPSPIAKAIAIRSIDLSAKLSEAEPSGFSKPVYARAMALGRINEPSANATVSLPAIKRIANELLA
jgi:hypothetical protein